MKAYSMDLRELVVEFVNKGGSKTEAAKHFSVSRGTVYLYLKAFKTGTLEPKTSWGTWRKLNPNQLKEHVEEHPQCTLMELAKRFNVSHHAVWMCLKKLGFTLKKSHVLSRTR